MNALKTFSQAEIKQRKTQGMKQTKHECQQLGHGMKTAADLVRVRMVSVPWDLVSLWQNEKIFS